MWRDDAYLLDMLLAARKVIEFTRGVAFEEFESNEILQDAVILLIQIIGEAASKISRGSGNNTATFRGRKSSGCGIGWCTSISA